MDITKRQNRLVTGFFLLSLLIHLLLLLIPEESMLSRDAKPEPVYVEVRPPQIRTPELDIPIRPELEKPREKPAERIAEADQVVEKEKAPEGQDAEDRPQAVKAPPVKPQPPVPVQEPVKEQPPSEQPATEEDIARRVTKDAEHSRAEPKPEPKPKPSTKPVPDLKSLTQISPNTLAQIDSDWRRKYREDVERDDTVWMNTEQSLLISFMRRFRTKIYNVWNYPSREAAQNHQGTCLVRITISRDGEVLNVQLLESSGYRGLDQEVIRAVKAGASYGPLPRAYKNPDLKIMAFFQYNLSQKRGRRPGAMY